MIGLRFRWGQRFYTGEPIWYFNILNHQHNIASKDIFRARNSITNWFGRDWYKRLRATFQFSCDKDKSLFTYLPKIDKSKGLLFPWLLILLTHSPFLSNSSSLQKMGTTAIDASGMLEGASALSANITKTNHQYFTIKILFKK